MAIFNESFLQKTIDGFINEGFLDRFKKKEDKKPDKNFKKDESSQKKKGLLTREDISNALSLTNHIIGENSTVGKYLDLYTVDELMKDYSKSKYDRVVLGMLYTMNTGNPNDQDVLIPCEDSDWFNGDIDKRRKEIEDLLDNLSEKLEKEISNKYGDSFVLDYSSTYYGYFYAIDSVKPKEFSNKDK